MAGREQACCKGALRAGATNESLVGVQICIFALPFYRKISHRDNLKIKVLNYLTRLFDDGYKMKDLDAEILEDNIFGKLG